MRWSGRWQWSALADLAPGDVYALLRLRSEVFVVEQQCVFLDADGSDADAMHLLAWDGTVLAGCARCFPAGAKYAEASIGRIATAATHRATGLGRVLVREAIARLHAEWGAQPIRIGAQARLQRFYEGHGFAVAGPDYDEDGIRHCEMLRPHTLETTTC